jgi:hypothetical protein
VDLLAKSALIKNNSSEPQLFGEPATPPPPDFFSAEMRKKEFYCVKQAPETVF